jgi:hypothetical protein
MQRWIRAQRAWDEIKPPIGPLEWANPPGLSDEQAAALQELITASQAAMAELDPADGSGAAVSERNSS